MIRPDVPRSCPLRMPYGGIPGGGGYGSWTDYEVAAQSIAEAAHCMLGSIEKDSSLPSYEVKHIEEEMQTILGTIRMFSGLPHVRQFWRKSPHRSHSRASIASVSPKLRELAEKLGAKVETSGKAGELGSAAYALIAKLAEKMGKSVEKEPPAFNAIDKIGPEVEHLKKIVESLRGGK